FVVSVGWYSVVIYVIVFCSSLAEDVEFKELNLVPGFEIC
ncbi:MAG: hypothetical protein JWQ38_730, partial [Flavipsychrobacter sp.]|nr:hypothetical protein [Flavipsychrobacter sp.]